MLVTSYLRRFTVAAFASSRSFLLGQNAGLKRSILISRFSSQPAQPANKKTLSQSSSTSTSTMTSNEAATSALEATAKHDFGDERLNSLPLEERHKLRIIQMEYDVALYAGERVAEQLTTDQWFQLLACRSQGARTKMHSFFRKKELTRINDERKKEERQKAHQERLKLRAESTEPHPPKNTIFQLITDSKINKGFENRVLQAMRFGQKLVFDFSYEDDMTEREVINTVDQFLTCYGLNRRYVDCFHMYLCNVREDGRAMKAFRKAIPTEDWETQLIDVKKEHYLDVFPRQQLCYLSADSPNILRKFDHDTTYIIGGIVDLAQQRPLSLARAKRDRIAHAKLPLDLYLKWVQGSKNLTLDQITGILLEAKRTDSFKDAFEKFIPKRKVTPPSPEKLDRNMKVLRSK